MLLLADIKSAKHNEAVSVFVSDQQKMAQRVEGARLRSFIDRAKENSPGLNQTKLAEMLGLKHQSQISHWCTGLVRIPDEALITLAETLEFDPAQVRPEIADYIARAQKALGTDASSLKELIDLLQDSEIDSVERYIRFVLESRGEK